MKRIAFRLFPFGLMLVAPLPGCDDNDSNKQQTQRQETMLAQATNAVGMPAITNFAERRMMKAVLELRDKSMPTITYIADLQGHLHKVCDSIGYGLPYATQYTSPEYLTWRANNGYHRMPQADPNGLFSPQASEGTWVNCQNPETKQLAVVYIEPRVVVTPFALKVE